MIAPGTGLGEAYLVWDGQRYQAHPSEGGHASFAPCTRDEIDLLEYLLPRFGHLSFERVCSGSGIPNLYEYLLQSGRHREPDWLKTALAQGTLQVIGADNLDEYHRFVETDKALERRFHPILVREPSVEETIRILEGIRLLHPYILCQEELTVHPLSGKQ